QVQRDEGRVRRDAGSTHQCERDHHGSPAPPSEPYGLSSQGGVVTEFRIIERDEVGYEHGTGWGTRPLPATEVWIHYPGAKQPPPETATEAEDIAYARYLDEIGYARFQYADYVDGVDVFPGDPGA